VSLAIQVLKTKGKLGIFTKNCRVQANFKKIRFEPYRFVKFDFEQELDLVQEPFIKHYKCIQKLKISLK
jgi:hypothetical protein